jgi:hypothetical protein
LAPPDFDAALLEAPFFAAAMEVPLSSCSLRRFEASHYRGGKYLRKQVMAAAISYPGALFPLG